MDISFAAKKFTCLKVNENNELCLNIKHSFYTQIQRQIRILNISKCYFVLCTKNGIHIGIVTFDKHFWGKVLCKLTQLYDNFMLPEIVYPSVKFGLPAIDISKFQWICNDISLFKGDYMYIKKWHRFIFGVFLS